MPGWDTTDQYHRFRIRDPGDFVEGSFRTTDFDGKLPDGVKVIRGKLKENNEWASQSIMFDKDKWTLEDAKKWYAEHKDSVKGFMTVKFTQPSQWKSIDDENWTIEGYASTDDIDAGGDKILPSAFEKTLPKFMKNPVLLFFHPLHFFASPDGALPIGKILSAEIKPRGLWVKAEISKTAPKIWTLIKEGILKAFSIGFDWLTNEEEDTEINGNIRIIKNLSLFEISVVPIGMNPDALFQVAKAKGINLELFLKKDDGGKIKQDELFECECIECGYKMTSEKHCVELKCPKCNGQMRRVERPGPGKKNKDQNKQNKEEEEMDVKIQQDLQDATKFINDLKEQIKEIPTKSELKEFEDQVKTDLLKVTEEHQKKERKIRFAAELNTDPYAGSSALAHPLVYLAKTPKQKFANLLTVSTKDQHVRDMQVASDDLLLTHILMKKFNPGYAGIKSLAMFERYSQVSSDFRKALDTATAGEGAEWIPTGFSAELIDKVRLELKVAGLFQSFTMPTSPFKYPLLTGDVTVYYAPESLADLSEKIPASNITTSDLTFTAKKLAARILCSDEITEDSIVAILPVLKADLAKGLATGLEDVIINGDTTDTHQDEDVTNAKDHRKAFNGLRKLANMAEKYDASTYAAAALRAVRKLMGKYGVNPADLAFIMSISAYIQALSFTEVATVDKFGEQATWLKGYLTALDGVPITVSEKVRQDLNATGVYGGTTKTQTIVLLAHKNSFMIGNRRLVTVKSKEEIETDQEILVITQRLDFQKKYATAEQCVGLGYNITS